MFAPSANAFWLIDVVKVESIQTNTPFLQQVLETSSILIH